VPPLLADLIRRAAAGRGLILAETAAAAADVIILGPGASPPPAGALPVLAISPCLNHISGPHPADLAPFTPDTLGALLRKIAEAI
jgi:hypothetical protein